MVTEFRGWSYDQRLRSLNWCTLEERRSRGDMIEVFKILNGFDFVAPNTFFNRSFTGLRGHEFKLYKSSFCTNLGKLFRIGIVYRSMLCQVILLIHLKIDWVGIICSALSGVYISRTGFLPLVGHLVY